MHRPVHFTTIARAAPVALVRRRRRTAVSADTTVAESGASRDDDLSPFQAVTSGTSALRAAGAPTTPAFQAALMKLAPGGD